MFRLQGIFKRQEVKLASLIIVIIIVLILIIEILLNLWIRASLSASLRSEDPQAQIKASISWLSMKDFLQGRVKWVRINAGNCKISDLKYLRFQLENDGFIFNLPLLLKKKRLRITAAEKTRITATITERSLQEYLNFKHPGFNLDVAINPQRIRLTGRATFLGNKVPVRLEGKLLNPTGKTIRFYPVNLSISGHYVPERFLEMLGNQIPLEFSVLEDWPLQISELRLRQGILHVSLKEAATKR